MNISYNVFKILLPYLCIYKICIVCENVKIFILEIKYNLLIFITQITQLADRIASLSQATSSEGVRCTEVISLFYSEDYQYANVIYIANTLHY